MSYENCKIVRVYCESKPFSSFSRDALGWGVLSICAAIRHYWRITEMYAVLLPSTSHVQRDERRRESIVEVLLKSSAKCGFEDPSSQERDPCLHPWFPIGNPSIKSNFLFSLLLVFFRSRPPCVLGKEWMDLGVKAEWDLSLRLNIVSNSLAFLIHVGKKGSEFQHFKVPTTHL